MRVCQVCAHIAREAIDREILAGVAKSVVSRRYGLSPDATERHARLGHVIHREVSVAAEGILAPEEGDDILARLGELSTIVRNLMGSCIKNRQHMQSLAAVRELTKIYELVARMTGQLDSETRVNIAIVQQQQQAAEQELMLERLTVPERIELRRLVAKAQGELETPETPETPEIALPVVLVNGTANGPA